MGYGPKLLERVLRLRRAERIALGGETLGLFAALAGYADQAHLVRECRELSGRVPSDLFETRGAAPRYVPRIDDRFVAAERFLLGSGRLLERRLFGRYFLAAPPSCVLQALAGYRNDDGGFGHALEPDLRCPASLPVFVEIALDAMVAARARDDDTVLAACEFLSVTSDPAAGGAVAAASPVIESFPRAAHWTAWSYEPGLNPTAGLTGRLFALGVEHPFREQAARWCWERLEWRGIVTLQALRTLVSYGRLAPAG